MTGRQIHGTRRQRHGPDCGVLYLRGAMDKLAVFQCDDTVSQSQRLAIIAQFAAHGIDVAILPAGMEMIAITDGADPDDTD